jgi:ribosomal protein S18 acetylase RimI-like enzyme
MADTLPHITIRRATGDDAEALGALSRETFVDTFVRGFAIPYSDSDLAAFLEAHHSPATYAAMLADPAVALWIAEDSTGAMAGYAVAGPAGLPVDGCEAGHGELRRLYVARAAQGGGLAPRLMAEALRWLRADERTVWLGVWSLNERAQRFYARWGFETVAQFDYPVGQTIDREFAMRRAAGPL